ncbi:hypothetical protein [Lysobacter sp. H23M47]|uniref:hypothetical protein n=1 Tax=Lysobacter sp. H23M47 TaxID=2781024 RepID=UPI0018813444|nr:hypothetical protein [Lysobacter sp. H23M47]QOW24694.1 hypothetical protein INQ43_00910 [Lysobacter sp. H23M47]
MNVPMRSVQTIAGSLRQALDYVEASTGINLHRGRLREYLELLDRAAAGECVDGPSLWGAALESADIEAAATLRADVLTRVRHRLGELAAGPLVPNGLPDAGRDLAFELATASLMQGVDPDVDMERPSDVVLCAEGHPVLIECKRPSSAGAFRRRMIDGYRQLSNHRRDGQAGYGAIAADLSLLVNPGNGILPAESRDAAINALYGHIRLWLQMAAEELQRARRNVRDDAGVHLLFFRLRCLVGIANGPPVVAQVWHAEPLIALDSPEFALIYRAMCRVQHFSREVHIVDAADPRALGVVPNR